MLLIGKMVITMKDLREITFIKTHKLTPDIFNLFPRFSVRFKNVNIFIRVVTFRIVKMK